MEREPISGWLRVIALGDTEHQQFERGGYLWLEKEYALVAPLRDCAEGWRVIDAIFIEYPPRRRTLWQRITGR